MIGYPHPIKGNAIAAFVISGNHVDDIGRLKKEITDQINKTVGPIATPEKIFLVSGLPKTRSGKIMRRILKKIIQGERNDFGDTSTLIDPSVVSNIIHDVTDAAIEYESSKK